MGSTNGQPGDTRQRRLLAGDYLQQSSKLAHIVHAYVRSRHPEGTLVSPEINVGSVGTEEFRVRYLILDPSAADHRLYALCQARKAQATKDAEAEAAWLEEELRQQALRECGQGKPLSFADIPFKCEQLVKQRMAEFEQETAALCQEPPRWVWDDGGWRDEVSGARLGGRREEAMVLICVGAPLPGKLEGRAALGSVLATDQDVTDADVARFREDKCLVVKLGSAFEQFVIEHTDPRQRIASDVPEI